MLMAYHKQGMKNSEDVINMLAKPQRFKYRDLQLFDSSSIVNQKKIIHSYVNGNFKKRNPRTRKDWIGAWCSLYSISDVLDKFLSDIYEPFSYNRYTYLPGSTKGGLVIYDDDTHAHSFHSTDIICGKNVNSFELYITQIRPSRQRIGENSL